MKFFIFSPFILWLASHNINKFYTLRIFYTFNHYIFIYNNKVLQIYITKNILVQIKIHLLLIETTMNLFEINILVQVCFLDQVCILD